MTRGVPTPYTVHVHPYPTRFHGGIWTRPYSQSPVAPTPYSVLKPDDFAPAAYARYPFRGVGALDPTAAAIWKLASAVSMAASAFHGYKRNQSIGWALAWGAMGALFPVITPTIALAQGFGEKKKG
jgi:hypothetical protein